MLINNITSAFAYNGVPAANGSVEVYTDDTTNQLANLTFMDGKTPAPNPARLNSNGGLGQPVLTELGAAFCVVRNARRAVLFSYHLTGGGEGGGCVFFRNHANTPALRLLPAHETYCAFVKSPNFKTGFFVSVQGQNAITFMASGIHPEDIRLYDCVKTVERDGSCYLVIYGAGDNVDVYWETDYFEPVTDAGLLEYLLGSEAKRSAAGNFVKFRLGEDGYLKDEYEYPHPDYPNLSLTRGTGLWTVTSDRAYIESLSRLAMMGPGQAAFSNGYSFAIADNSKFLLRERSSIEVERMSGIAMSNEARVEVRNESGVMATDRGLLRASGRASLDVSDDANIRVSNRASINVASGAHINVENESGLDVRENSDVYIGSIVPVYQTSTTKLWMFQKSMLIMAFEGLYNDLIAKGQQFDRLLAILDQARLKMTGFAKLELGQSADIYMTDNARLKMIHAASLSMESVSKIEMFGDAKIYMQTSSLIDMQGGCSVEMQGGSNLKINSGSTVEAVGNLEFSNSKILAKYGYGLDIEMLPESKIMMDNANMRMTGNSRLEMSGGNVNVNGSQVDMQGGASVDMNSGSRVDMNNGSSIQMNGGCRIEMFNGGVLRLQNGGAVDLGNSCRMEMTEASRIKLQNESKLEADGTRVNMVGGDYEMHGNSVYLGGATIDIGGASFLAKDSGGLIERGILAYYDAFLFYNKVVCLTQNLAVPAYGSPNGWPKENFLGTEYTFVNRSEHTATVEYGVYYGTSAVQASKDLAPNTYFKLLLVGYDTSDFPVFAEQA